MSLPSPAKTPDGSRPRSASAWQEVAASFGITHLLDRSIFRLSGGQKQRIAVAAACMLRPRLLVLDEPTSNLDAQAMADLNAMLAQIKASGVTIVVAEHRLAWCVDLADRYVLFDSGRIALNCSAERFRDLPERRRGTLGAARVGYDTVPCRGAAERCECRPIANRCRPLAGER